MSNGNRHQVGGTIGNVTQAPSDRVRTHKTDGEEEPSAF